MARLLPISSRGVPTPFLITPRTNEEANCGKATLIAFGDLDVLIAGVQKVAPERTDLVKKFEQLRDG